MKMKKSVYLLALIAFTLISCDRNEIENKLNTAENLGSSDENRQRRPVILGEQINNPYLIENILAALDTLKAHPEEQNSCMKAPAVLENIEIKPTDLYVRFLPTDSSQYALLMNDTSLLLFDYPLDYQKIQTGDYYQDPTVAGAYTWLYTTVPVGYESLTGITYEVIEELFIPEHSPYYSIEESPAKVKAADHVKANVAHKEDYVDALKTILAISFMITDNADQLNEPTKNHVSTDMQKAKSYVVKSFLWKTWREAVYNPEGYFWVSTPTGIQPLANVRVRVARYFTFYETRTDQNGRFYFNKQFGEDAIFPNVEYFVYFDGENGNNSWKLMNGLGGTTYTSVGVHSPDRYDMTFYPTSDYWGKCIIQNAITKYINISRTEGVSLPPAELKIDPDKSSFYTKGIPPFVNNAVKIELSYQNNLKDFYKITAAAWSQLTYASLLNRMITTQGTNWTADYWKTFGNNEYTLQQFGLVAGWAIYREEVLLNRYSKVIDGYFLDNSESMRRIIYAVNDYITMFRDLVAINCSYQSIERALCARSVLQFRNNLIATYPGLSSQIKNIFQKVSGDITFMTYNLYIKHSSSQSSRLPGFAEVISDSKADVIALQEVGMLLSMNELARKIELKGKKYDTELFYGIGMLWNPKTVGTPKKITTKEITPLNGSGDKETRAYMIAEFDDFYFISTHYSLDGNEQNRMTEEILAYAQIVTKPIYVAGDFNATPYYPVMEKFKNNNFIILNDTTHRTAPVHNPDKLIDMVLGFKRNSTQHTIISRGISPFSDTGLRNLSDHLPYYVTVNIND